MAPGITGWPPSVVIAFELWPAGTLTVVVAPVNDESTFSVAPPV